MHLFCAWRLSFKKPIDLFFHLRSWPLGSHNIPSPRKSIVSSITVAYTSWRKWPVTHTSWEILDIRIIHDTKLLDLCFDNNDICYFHKHFTAILVLYTRFILSKNILSLVLNICSNRCQLWKLATRKYSSYNGSCLLKKSVLITTGCRICLYSEVFVSNKSRFWSRCKWDNSNKHDESPYFDEYIGRPVV